MTSTPESDQQRNADNAVMLEVDGLTRRFGPILAVDGVSFSVRRGEVLGFLGPNGAGKTTAMRMITGFLAPTAGKIAVCGYDVETHPREIKQRIGYLPEGAPAYPDMTPKSLLDFVASVRGVNGARRRERFEFAVERTHIKDVLLQPIETLSKGYRRRVGLAQAVLHDPEVLILVEPTDGLDPNQKHEVRTMIADMSKDKCIVVSTHILEEVHAVCSRALIIARGRIVADGTPAELEARSRYHNAVTVAVEATAVQAVRTALEALPGVAAVELLNGAADAALATLTAFPKDGKSILADVGPALRAAEVPVSEIRVEIGRLDEVFRSVTTSP